MARKTKEERLQEVHDEAIREFEKIQAALRDERLQCLEDRRFYSMSGAQWEGPLAEQFENKPRLEVNKIHLAVIRIINEYRNNRIDVEFISKDTKDTDALADTCNGLYRADEQDSQAEEAYDNAFEEGVGGGFGAWRLRAEYEDEEDYDNDHQRIRIEPIYDADSSVFFDLNSKRMDKSDAKCCFVLTAMTRDAFEEKYGEDNLSSVPKRIQKTYFDWNTPDVVYVAEYFRIEEKGETVYLYENAMGEEKRLVGDEYSEEAEQELFDTGFKLERTRKIKRKRVHKYVISGDKVLEDSGYIAGQCIPIVPFYGKRWFIDNVERCMGHVRLAKDIQRLKNMQLSKLAEISALSAVEKPILTPEQIAGHEVTWSEDNIKNYPYLLVNPMTDLNGNITAAGPVAYTKPPIIPPALAALIQLADVDINDILGNQQAGERVASNVSGKVLELVQNSLGMQSFIYMSNFAKAVKRSGEIWLSMSKDVMVEPGRKMKVIGGQDEIDFVELMKPKIENGEIAYENDISRAKFDTTVTVGPSSSSRRESTVRSLLGMMQTVTNQEDMNVLSAMVMMNMDGEGIGGVRDYYRMKLVRMGVVKPTQQEAEMLMAESQNRQPTPQDQYFTAAAAEAEAKAVKAAADAQKTVVEAEKINAETAEILSGLDRDAQKHVLEVAKQLKEIGQPMQ